MTSYLKAVVAALGTAIATLVAECADGHVTPLRLLVAAGTLVATFAAVYFTPNNQSQRRSLRTRSRRKPTS